MVYTVSDGVSEELKTHGWWVASWGEVVGTGSSVVGFRRDSEQMETADGALIGAFEHSTPRVLTLHDPTRP